MGMETAMATSGKTVSPRDILTRVSILEGQRVLNVSIR